MINNPQVPFHRLVLSLSEAVDGVHPDIADHQQRVAYIACRVGRQLDLPDAELVSLFHAAVLHDVGLIGPENRIRVMNLQRLEANHWHAEVGYRLLKANPLFHQAAPLVRWHHVAWNDGRGVECDGRPVPPACHVLSLADRLERMIDRAVPILDQADDLLDRLAAMSGPTVQPDAVEALRAVAQAEAFWLDAAAPRIYSVLLRLIDWPTLVLDERSIGPVSEIFARLVDLSSPWTMVHSAGVTATAVALSQRLNFSPREQSLLRAAGHLHDLGKLAIPVRILDKPGKLTAEERAVMRTHTYHTFRILDTIGGMPQIAEWAAFHHERLDATGYPFRHRGEDLTLGSRVMAVADVLTAVAEDRPYRPGMSPAQSLEVLDHLVRNGGLDGDVVAVVHRDFDAIDAQRRSEQSHYGRQQDELVRLISPCPAAVPRATLTG